VDNPEIIESPMGRMNVDRNGNVLFLDEERLNRKEQPDKPVRRNRPRGLGVKDLLVSCVGAKPVNYGLFTAAFRLLVRCMKRFLRRPGIGRNLFRRVMMVGPVDEPSGYTKGVWLPLDVDLSDHSGSERVPWDLLEQAIRSSTYIGGLNRCICRETFGCSDFPHDMACMFFGRSGEVVVKNGIAERLTPEQALERVARAKGLGLNAEAVHVELEQYVWGLKNQDMEQFLEVCFCCPCCCVAMKFCREGTRDIKDRWTPSGWTATIDQDACIACGSCAPACPQECIGFDEDGVASIDQEHCMGCGYCVAACPASDCIRIRQTMPMRDSIHDYFLAEDGFDLKAGY